MKRHFLTIFLLIIVCFAACLPASANPRSMLILGDSISTGYGLLPDADGKLQSYGNQLAAEFGLSSEQYKNLAVNGADSSDLLASLPAMKTEIQSADTIVISIGGNDVLGKMLNLLAQLTEKSTITEAVEALLNGKVPDAVEQFSSDVVLDEFNAAVNCFGSNLTEIIGTLKALNPHARVIFLTQYNPVNGADKFVPEPITINENVSLDPGAGYDALLKFSENVITGLNDQMKTAIAACEFGELADVYSAFAGRGGELTRIYQADIHPNQAGHDLIASLLSEMLQDDDAETTTSTPQTTAAPTTQAPVTIDASETSAKPAESTFDEPSSPESSAVLLAVTTDDSTATQTMVLLGIAVLCMTFGLMRMLRKKKK